MYSSVTSSYNSSPSRTKSRNLPGLFWIRELLRSCGTVGFVICVQGGPVAGDAGTGSGSFALLVVGSIWGDRKAAESGGRVCASVAVDGESGFISGILGLRVEVLDLLEV